MAALRILVVNDEAPLAEALREGLAEAGYEVVATVPADIRLPERVAEFTPDLIVIDEESAGRDILEHVCVATQDAPRPIVLFTQDRSPDRMQRAIAAGVSGYVVAGLAADRVQPILDVAVARFRIEQDLRAQLADARTRLEDRKLLDRAKGLLMARQGLSEDEAHRRMRRMAMDRNLRLIDVARRVIDAAELLG
jgi:response regulator NasT